MGEGRGLPAGTLTFLFTDIEGSTKLLNELGTERFHEVLAAHTRLLRDAFKDGVEVRIEGDALFVVFPVAAKAVRGAAAAQRALGAATFPHSATVRVRMGMHTGEGTPASAEAGADYVGIDVHRAARVAAAANGGQVLLTQATATLAGPDLGDGLSFRELGEFRLKWQDTPEKANFGYASWSASGKLEGGFTVAPGGVGARKLGPGKVRVTFPGLSYSQRDDAIPVAHPTLLSLPSSANGARLGGNLEEATQISA